MSQMGILRGLQEYCGEESVRFVSGCGAEVSDTVFAIFLR